MMKSLFILLLCTSVTYGVTTKCPLMVDDDVDPEETTQVLDQTIEFCCGSCVKAFDANVAYYIKAIPEIGSRFTESQKKQLKVCCVKLLEQRYCPVYPDRVVNPNSPTVEYLGKTIYLWSSSAVRRWNKKPDEYYYQAVERGHLSDK